MNNYFYYYKTDTLWVFEDGTELTGHEGAMYQIKKRREGKTAWRLFLDLPEDYSRIKSIFKTPDYWKKTTPQKEQQR